MQTITVIDSHTGGEPTRLIVDGGPDLGGGNVAQRAKVFQRDFDHIRTAVVGEPRGSEVMVGGLICRPQDPDCTAAVIFFDTAGFLGMCGHGTIGLMVTLRHLGRIETGRHQIETPVGIITATLLDANTVKVRNVPSYRYRQDVPVNVPDFGTVVGDIAWGGNWFFVVKHHSETLQLSNKDRLLQFTKLVRGQLRQQGVYAENGEPINHVELHGPSEAEDIDCRSFVLCPGSSFDRSPCGTGTSARMACLAADGQLQPGQTWRQESIVGSVFEGSIEIVNQQVVPSITGQAWVCGETRLLLNPDDPFQFGIRG